MRTTTTAEKQACSTYGLLNKHARSRVVGRQPCKDNPMPVILWFLGVPLALVFVLMLLGVVSF